MTKRGASAAFEQEHVRIEREASVWLVRLNGARSEADQAAFEAWLAADERHGAAYDAASRVWEDIGELKHLHADRKLRRSWRDRLADALRPPALIGMAAALGAVALALLFTPPMLQRPDASFGTEIGQLRTVRLGDGSVVTLGAHSAIDVLFTETERRVTLRSGEAFFDVAHDESRPFFVDAGGPLVRVVGTKFNVRRSDEQVSVAVLEGVVRVSPSGAEDPDAMRTLEAGRSVEFGRRVNFLAPPAPVVLAPIPPAHVAAWRDGRLSYDDAPLSVLISDVNRYYAPGVVLTSRDLGELRITAAFRADEIPAFLDALSAVLPVTVEQGPDHAFIVRRVAS